MLNSRLVHVDDSDENLMRSPMARLHVRGHIRSVCEQLLRLLDAPQRRRAAALPAPAEGARRLRRHGGRARRRPPACSPVKPQRLLATLGERCPPHTRFVADAGNSAAWAVHYLAPLRDRRSARLPRNTYLPTGQEQRSSRSSWLRVTMDFAPMGWAIGSAVGIAWPTAAARWSALPEMAAT